MSSQAIGMDSNNPDTVAWLAIGLLTIISNSYVLSVIICHRKLHNPSNAILSSMFISGCAIALFYIFPGRVFTYWRASSVFICSTTPSFAFASLTCYNLHLCGICMDKIISITSPFRHRRLSNSRNTAILIILLWSVSYITSFLPLYTYRPYSNRLCVYFNDSRAMIRQDQNFQFALFTTLIFIPMIATVILYVLAFYRINRKTISTASACSVLRRQKKKFIRTKNLKIIRQMIFMLGLFALCWLPFFIFFIILQFYFNPVTRMVYSILRYLALSYPIINPILLGFFTASLHDQIQLSCCPNMNLKNLSMYPKDDQATKAKGNQIRHIQSCRISQNGCQSNTPLQTTNTDQHEDQIEEIAL